MAHLKTGTANICEKYLIPTDVPLPRGATEPVECAMATHCFFVRTTTGQVYSWGSGSYGRLGHGSTDSVLQPRRIQGLESVQRIFAGNWNAGAIDANGQAHVWGHMLQQSSPVMVEFPKPVVVTKICCGMKTVLFLTVDGELFGMGSNSKLQCGVSARQFGAFLRVPRRVLPSLTEPIVDCALGAVNGIALTESGKVYMWGTNVHGQMGIGQKDGKKYRPRVVDIAPVLPEDDQALSVFCSLSDNYVHAGCVLRSGRGLFWGSNYKGKLATGDSAHHYSPLLSPHLARAVRVLTGGIHNMAIDMDDNLLSFGCGSDGRLGHPEAQGHRYLYKEYIPRIIEPLRGKIVDAAASYYAGMAVVRNE